MTPRVASKEQNDFVLRLGQDVFFDKWNGHKQPIGVLRGTVIQRHYNRWTDVFYYRIRVGRNRYYSRRVEELRLA